MMKWTIVFLLALMTLTARAQGIDPPAPPDSDNPAIVAIPAKPNDSTAPSGATTEIKPGDASTTITITIPNTALAPAERGIDPTSPIYPLGSLIVPFSDDKNNTGTAVLLLMAVRQVTNNDRDLAYTVDVRAFRLKKDKIEQFDSYSIKESELEAFAAGLDETTSDNAAFATLPLSEQENRASTFRSITRGKYTYRFSRSSLTTYRRAVRLGYGWAYYSRRWYASSHPSYLGPASVKALPDLDMSKPVSVRGYVRKDGTYVRPHTRSAPGSGRGKH